jgi:hypothetical protein
MFEFPDPQSVLPDRPWVLDLKDKRDRLIWISGDLKLTVTQDDEESDRLLFEYTKVLEGVYHAKGKSQDDSSQLWVCSDSVQVAGKMRWARFWIARGIIFSAKVHGTNADEVIEVWRPYCAATNAAMETYLWGQSGIFGKN